MEPDPVAPSRSLAGESLRILAVLAGVHILLYTAGAVARLALPGDDVLTYQLANGIEMLVVGVLLLVVFRPSPATLGFSLVGASARAKTLSILGVAVLLLLVATSWSFGPVPFVLNVVFGLITPAFEESLFRGWVYSRLRRVVPAAGRWPVILAGGVLFALWHIGYAPGLAAHPMQPDLLPLVGFKVAYGFVLGIGLGWLRERTGSAYAGAVLHGLANVFAP